MWTVRGEKTGFVGAFLGEIWDLVFSEHPGLAGMRLLPSFHVGMGKSQLEVKVRMRISQDFPSAGKIGICSAPIPTPHPAFLKLWDHSGWKSPWRSNPTIPCSFQCCPFHEYSQISNRRLPWVPFPLSNRLFLGAEPCFEENPWIRTGKLGWR